MDYSAIYVEGFQNGFEGIAFLPYLEARALESTDSDAFTELWETYELGYYNGEILKQRVSEQLPGWKQERVS